MKKIITLIIFLSFTLKLVSQNLSGFWSGGLPQNDKTFVFTMEANIIQDGNSISGTTKYTNPSSNGDYVVEKFVGTINANEIEITEYEVIDSYFGSRSTYGWCVKTMKGSIRMDEINNRLIIEGNWSSRKVWYKNTQSIRSGRCAPGQFIIYKELPKKLNLSGVTYNKNTLEGISSSINLISVDENVKIESNVNGNYEGKLSPNTNYRLIVSSKGYNQKIQDLITLEEDLILNVFLDPENDNSDLEMNKVYILDHVLFQRSKSIILPESFEQLGLLRDHMMNNTNLRILIEGHTDGTGNSQKNIELSQKRADAIKQYLEKNGIDKNRITTRGYGDSKLICEPGCKDNRRVEYQFLNN